MHLIKPSRDIVLIIGMAICIFAYVLVVDRPFIVSNSNQRIRARRAEEISVLLEALGKYKDSSGKYPVALEELQSMEPRLMSTDLSLYSFRTNGIFDGMSNVVMVFTADPWKTQNVIIGTPGKHVETIPRSELKP